MVESRFFACPVYLLYYGYKSRFGAALLIKIISRHASSSSKRWQSRKQNDMYAQEAKVQGLKSRAAFKLLEVLVRMASVSRNTLMGTDSHEI